MKQLLLTLLLVSFASSAALADSPEAILKDYRKQAAKALERINQSLEKAAAPLITKLVKDGDTAGAEQLTAQLKDKLVGEPVLGPQSSAAQLFSQYDEARTKALEPVQKSSLSRIESLLRSAGNGKIAVVAELAKAREEIELDALNGPAVPMPEVWTFHPDDKPDSAVFGEMHFLPDGTLEMLDRGRENTPRLGHWKPTKRGDKVTITMSDLAKDAPAWIVLITGTNATLDRDVGRRYMRVKAK